MKKQRKTRVAVTRELYDNVRFAVNVEGWEQKIAAKAYDVSQATASKIVNSKNFKQYKIESKKRPDDIPNLVSESPARLKIINQINNLLNKLV